MDVLSFTIPELSDSLRRLRKRCNGLARPAWFVEGFGEDLPYRDGVYDTVTVNSALDHCAQPDRVLAEAARVLRPGGRLFIVQGFDPLPGEKVPGRSFVARLARLLADPRRLHRAVRQRFFHRGDPHLHHFTRAKLHALVTDAGFSDVRETVVSERFGVAIVEGWSHV
jgi:ubiquinone/menaquinone biosynthesis C-methylase UbiE